MEAAVANVTTFRRIALVHFLGAFGGYGSVAVFPVVDKVITAGRADITTALRGGMAFVRLISARDQQQYGNRYHGSSTIMAGEATKT